MWRNHCKEQNGKQRQLYKNSASSSKKLKMIAVQSKFYVFNPILMNYKIVLLYRFNYSTLHYH